MPFSNEGKMEIMEQCMLKILIASWKNILGNIKKAYNIPEVSFEAWLRQLNVYAIKGHVVYVLTPMESYGISYLRRKYLPWIQEEVKNAIGEEYHVEIIASEEISCLECEKTYDKENEDISDELLERVGLNRHYTFSNYVVGSSNKLACLAAMDIVNASNMEGKFLTVYGAEGVGKTHLVHAIGIELLRKFPHFKILYIEMEQYIKDVRELLNSENAYDKQRFYEKYYTADMLIFDDASEMIGKSDVENAFIQLMHIFKVNKKCIVVATTVPLYSLPKFEEWLGMDFNWGYCVKVEIPDYDMRMEILYNQAKEDEFLLGQEILEYIAQELVGDVNKLKIAYDKLLEYYKLNGGKISLEIAERELCKLGPIFEERNTRRIWIRNEK